MILKKTVAVCATVGVALTTLLCAVPAHADPVSNSYAIVGSDTLEDVVSALVNGSNLTGASVRTVVGGATLGSFDATGSPYITTKPNGPRFGRPNGSGDGVKALSYSMDATGTKPFSANPQVGYITTPVVSAAVITGEVDIARSSSAPTVSSSGTLAYVPFGRDAVSYVYQVPTNADTTGVQNLTAANLASIYKCSSGATTIGGQTYTPYIPQLGSGTRKSFLAMIQITENDLQTTEKSGGCVQVAQEHDARALAGPTSAPTPYAIMPMSVSRWVAMNTTASFDKRGTAALGTPNGIAPVTGTGTSMVPNSAYYNDATWGRDTYLVVEWARIDPSNAAGALDPNLAAALDSTKSTSLTNTQTNAAFKAGSVKLLFGFLQPSSITVLRAAATS